MSGPDAAFCAIGNDSVPPSFSVIFPTYQRRDLVCEAVTAMVRVEYAGDFEVVVVVDGSTDGTADALRVLDLPITLRLVEQANAGLAAARNAGAEAANGDVLLFLDDDMIADPGILSAHAARLATGADAVLGDIPLDPASPPGFLADGVGAWAAERSARMAGDEPLQLEDLLGGHLAVGRDLYRRLGGMDTAFNAEGRYGNEDLDFGVKLLRAHNVVFEPRAISYQRYVVTAKECMARAFKAGEADVRFARKHPERSAELFAQRRHDTVKERFILRPLATIPGLRRAIPAIAVALAEREHSLPAPVARGIPRLFLVTQRLAYWAGVAEARARATGEGLATTHRTARHEAPLILCYHAVRDLSADPVLANYGLPAEELAAQLDDLIACGHRFITPAAFADWLDAGKPIPDRSVLVTFDDGYAELPDAIETVLRPRGIAAIVFVVTGIASCSNEWDQTIGAGRLALVDESGMRRLVAAGCEIGSHTRTHAKLPSLDDGCLGRELDGSAEEIAAMGLPRPRFVAYPHGLHDARVRAAAKRAGYLAGMALEPAFIAAHHDRHALPRLEIARSDRVRRFRFKTRHPALFGQVDRIARSRHDLAGRVRAIAGRLRRMLAR